MEMAMSDHKSIVILGAGAMGAMYASIFYDKNPSCVAFAATGERYQQLAVNGVVVNNVHYPIPVLSPEDHSPPADLVIVALKDQHLSNGLSALKNRVGGETVILSIMNGLDSESIIGSVYGDEKLVYAIAVGTDPRREGNKVQYNISGTIFFGEADNTIVTDRVKRIQAVLDWAGLKYQTPVDMIRTMWWKFMINVGTNQVSAVLRAPYGVFQSSSHAQYLMESAMREVMVLAEAANVNLVEKDIADWYTFLNTLNPGGKTSMLQDIEAGRKTEVEIFGGKVIELGKMYGIPTPINAVLYHAIKVMETR
jgi:2-dehydropantoate 2-reductase